MTLAKFIFDNGTENIQEISTKPITVGRSRGCDVVIPDRHVSRRHLVISISPSKEATIENIGSNPVRVSDRTLTKGQSTGLHQGDRIVIGKTAFTFMLQEGPPSEDIAIEKGHERDSETILFTGRPHQSGPGLLVSGPGGEVSRVQLKRGSMLIGRAAECDLRLIHPTVSREHAKIESRNDVFYIKCISKTNPVILNGEEVRGTARLYGGDQIQIGAYAISFVSDRPEDVRPTKMVSGPFSNRLRPFLVVMGVAFLVAMAYLFYLHVYRPWTFRVGLRRAQEIIAKGDYGTAQRLLEDIMARDLPIAYRERAQDLLARAFLAKIRGIISQGNYQEAERLLVSFFKRHGEDVGDDGRKEEFLKLLDICRLEIAKGLERRGELLGAVRKYALIQRESPYFEEAQERISKIWFEYQARELKGRTIHQLLKEADIAFRKGHYLQPINRNAYAAYQAVLAIDPKNQMAKKRIEEIKAILKARGEDAVARKNCKEAMGYLERYLFINPGDQQVEKLLSKCRSSMAGNATLLRKGQKERIERLLKESGAESGWIMKYLFENGDKGDKRETPW